MPLPIVESFFREHVETFLSQLKSIQERIQAQQETPEHLVVELASAIREQSKECLRVEQELTADGEELAAAQARFQDAIDPWFRQSWFMERAKSKPRGYPGDYVLLTAIYDQLPKSEGFGKCLDLYFLQSDLAGAVRARMESTRQYLSSYISDADQDVVNVLNVASGPCREFFVGLDFPAEKTVNIKCIDADQEALDYVQSKIAAAELNANVELINYNALRLRSAKRNREKFGRPDVIYSIGLLDYIPDKHLVGLLQGLRETVRPGGVVFASFKDQLRYDKAEYQWFVDWFFFQRTEAQCRDLMLAAGFDGSCLKSRRDSSGIIVNFVGRTPVVQERYDAAHAGSIVPRAEKDAAAKDQVKID